MKCSSMPIRHSVALLLSAIVGLAAGGVDLRLVEAAKQRDWETVRGLIAHGSDVNVRQPDGATPLHWAAHWSDLSSVLALVAVGARVNAANDFGVTPLSLACTNANREIVEALLSAG